MIPTLHKYLAKDLLRTGALATVGLTLIVTTFAVFEPLRKEGLNVSQVLMLFWYLVPVMLSLTLPVGAVFAATLTYGRLAMDNELTACRASGVSRYALLEPAFALGVVVGLCTLGLSNWVAPRLARAGEATVMANVRGLFFQKLRSDSSFRKGPWLLYADAVDPQRNQLSGVVAIDMGDPRNPSFYTASAAMVGFTEAGEPPAVTVSAMNPVYGESKGFLLSETSQFTFGPFPVDEPLQEKEAFFDWGELQRIRRNPEHSREVQRMLRAIRRQLLALDLYEEMAAKINAGQVYELLHEEHYRYQFSAPAAKIDARGRLVLSGAGADGELPVVVTVYDMAGDRYRWFRCRLARLTASPAGGEVWGQPAGGPPVISVTLEDLTIHQGRDSDADPIRRREFSLGQLQMPPRIAQSPGVDLETLYRHPERFPSVEGLSRALHNHIKLRLLPGVAAEIHGRTAYGLGCILLIPIGAALGLIYRGGHILSAFALCCIPAMALVVLMLMGKEILTNPRVGPGRVVFGTAAIWSGVVLLAGLGAYLYGVVMRR